MRFAAAEEEVAFGEAVRSVLDKECGPGVVRAAWLRDDPLERSVWETLESLGALNVAVDGGFGFAVALLVEAGRAALPHSVIESVMVGAPHGLSSQLLATDLAGPISAHAHDAETFLLHDERGLHAVLAADVTTEAVETVDDSRRAGRIVGWSGGELVEADVEDAFHRGALGAAAVLLGLADRMLSMTVDYAKERHQFGVAIGSFQAVKHQLADALKDLSFARPAVQRAAFSLDTGADTARRDISMAKAMASDAAETVGRIALQAHGAIAYTVEYDLHLFLKRAWALERSWGSAADHRNRLADALGV